MKKILFLFLLLISSEVFAQKVEHGVLVGAGVGYVTRNKPEFTIDERFGYEYFARPIGKLGYRFRFMPEKVNFIDLDANVDFQAMKVYEYKVPALEDIDKIPEGGYGIAPGKSRIEFILPISVSASWNYRVTDRFHVGLGVSPTLYVTPNAAFDLGVLAKLGYRISNCCELGLLYKYGCLNTMKYFNDGPAMGRRGSLSDVVLSVYIPFSLK